MSDPTLNKFIKQLSDKYKLPEMVIELIVQSQFTFTREIIKKGELKNVRLPDLGIFAISERKVNHYKRKKEEEENNETIWFS